MAKARLTCWLQLKNMAQSMWIYASDPLTNCLFGWWPKSFLKMLRHNAEEKQKVIAIADVNQQAISNPFRLADIYHKRL